MVTHHGGGRGRWGVRERKKGRGRDGEWKRRDRVVSIGEREDVTSSEEEAARSGVERLWVRESEGETASEKEREKKESGNRT